MAFGRYFTDRSDAGKQLAARLGSYARQKDALILALPRGGVPVAYEVAKALRLPMDIYIIRKLGRPGHEEYALGALAQDGTMVLNEGATLGMLKEVIKAEKLELERRNMAYRGNRPQPSLAHKSVIIVDDGVATGATMKAAIAAIRESDPKEIITAVPVAAPSSCRELEAMADKVISVIKPSMLRSVGEYYRDFSQTTDEEVVALMGRCY